MGTQNERIDKYLWSVRLYKTRSNATDACKKKQVLIQDQAVKPSRLVQEGEDFKIKHPPVFKVYKIKQILHNRVGAKLVPEYLEEITPVEYLETLDIINKNIVLKRDRGTGRPTKKERRDLEDYFDDE